MTKLEIERDMNKLKDYFAANGVRVTAYVISTDMDGKEFVLADGDDAMIDEACITTLAGLRGMGVFVK